MKIGNFHIIRCHEVRFHWLPHRLTLEHTPGVFHWLWYSFGWRAPLGDMQPARIPLLERVVDLLSVPI